MYNSPVQLANNHLIKWVITDVISNYNSSGQLRRYTICGKCRVLSRIFSLGEKILKGMVDAVVGRTFVGGSGGMPPLPPRNLKNFEPSESGSEAFRDSFEASSCGITDRFLAKLTGATASMHAYFHLNLQIGRNFWGEKLECLGENLPPPLPPVDRTLK